MRYIVLIYKLPSTHRCFPNLFYGTVIDTVRRLCSMQRTDTLTLFTDTPLHVIRAQNIFSLHPIAGFSTRGPSLLSFKKVERENKTGTSQVGAISKAQIKSKGDPLETKKIKKKSQCRKTERGPFTLIWFCRLRLKSKKLKGAPWRQKNLRKKSHSVGKKSKGGTL